jgi:hypothetical protein
MTEAEGGFEAAIVPTARWSSRSGYALQQMDLEHLPEHLHLATGPRPLAPSKRTVCPFRCSR